MPKICDVFTASWGEKLCGPALIVPGMGKCGTNSLFTYTVPHPHLKWTEESEPPEILDFMNNGGSPEAARSLVEAVNPGVGPDGPEIWAIKNPAIAHGAILNEFGVWPSDFFVNLTKVARSLKRAFPSAVVAVPVCDPVTLPWRWFRHYVTHVWVQNGVPAATSAVLSQLQSLGFNSFTHFERLINPVDSGCQVAQDVSSKALALQQSLDGDVPVLFTNQSVSNQWCRGALVEMQYSNLLHALIKAGFEVGTDLAVFFMENWSSFGDDYMNQLLSMLRLSVAMFPWHDFKGYVPRYTTSSENLVGGLAADGPVPVPTTYLTTCVKECCALQLSLRVQPPWGCCEPDECVSAPPVGPPAPACKRWCWDRSFSDRCSVHDCNSCQHCPQLQLTSQLPSLTPPPLPSSLQPPPRLPSSLQPPPRLPLPGLPQHSPSLQSVPVISETSVPLPQVTHVSRRVAAWFLIVVGGLLCWCSTPGDVISGAWQALQRHRRYELGASTQADLVESESPSDRT